MRISASQWKWVGLAAAILIVSLSGLLTQSQWRPLVQKWLSLGADETVNSGDDGHHARGDPNSLKLSQQARLNVGLTKDMIRPIELASYTRTISVPAMVVGIPGKSIIKVVTPTTGVITEVYMTQGETAASGRPMFKIRLLHEDLVKAQTDYLKTLGEIDVENKEIARLEKLTKGGAFAAKDLLDRQYAKYKLEAVLRAQHESLLLHGLSETLVKEIVKSRKLKSEFVVYAPTIPDDGNKIRIVTKPASDSKSDKVVPQSQPSDDLSLVVNELKVSNGDFVEGGSSLAVLVDYQKLYVEGSAFEQDASELVRAAKNRWPVKAVLEGNDEKSQVIDGLHIAYLDHNVDPDSRAFRFYVDLPNQIVNKHKGLHGSIFVSWRFKPGQRLQLLVPVEQWEKQIVLPVDAVAKEGAEYYVFAENGSRFDRRPVHVVYRDQFNAVIENNGAVFPGDRVAFTGAQQMQMALQNKAGGGVDPHAGHSH